MIRNCRQEDMDCVGRLADAAWMGIYAMFRERYGEELFNLVTPNSHTSKSEQVLNYFRLHPDWIFVCEREGSVVGFITFFMHREKKLGEIYNNAVDPACGQKGVGQEMYAAVLN
jgi:N-acetylglutamate synthase-like GNAT family acetyltransferase